MFKDQRVHKVPRALRDRRDVLVILDFQDLKGTQEHLVYKAYKEQLELQDQLDRLVLLGLQDREVIQDQEASKGQMALQALQEALGLQDFQEMLVHLDLKEHQDNVDQMEQLEILDKWDSVDLLDNQVHLVLLVLQAREENRGHLVQLDPLVNQVQQASVVKLVCLGLKEARVRSGRLELQASRAHRVRLDQQDLKEQQVLLVNRAHQDREVT